MADIEKALSSIKKFGNAKITGFTCNQKAPVTLNLEIEVPIEKMGHLFASLDLKPTPELIETLETTLQVAKGPDITPEKLIYVC